jgi:hypothetical protein
MTIHDILNPQDPFITMKRDGSFDGNNDIDVHAQPLNPRCFYYPNLNPAGPMPCHNPEHYIHPLTGRYASGCLDFSPFGQKAL